MVRAMGMGLDQQTIECINLCSECKASCEAMIMHCVEMGGEHAEPDHIRLLQDCAEICDLSTNYMARKSQFVGQVCDVCARVNEKCAEMCEQFEDDDVMLSHAELCRRTAESCRKMV